LTAVTKLVRTAGDAGVPGSERGGAEIMLVVHGRQLLEILLEQDL